MAVRRLLPVVIIVMACAALVAGEAASPAPKPAETPKIVPPDPSAAVVAEGRCLYRQRDVDALVLVARRHVNRGLSEDEKLALEQAIVAMLRDREALLTSRSLLPACFTPQARDRLTLDVLDYQAEAKTGAAAASNKEPVVETAKPATEVGPVLVTLPVLRRVRTLDKGGKSELVLGITLRFADAIKAKAMEKQAPILQDAILAYIDGLDAATFTEPAQTAIKQGITAAIRAKVKEFPEDGVLITRIESGPVAVQPAP